MDDNATEAMELGEFISSSTTKANFDLSGLLAIKDSSDNLLCVLDPKKRKEYLVGRDPSNDIRTEDSRVSRCHGKFSYDSVWFYEDLNSTNGSILETDEMVRKQKGIEVSFNPEPLMIVMAGSATKVINRNDGRQYKGVSKVKLYNEPEKANINRVYLGSKIDDYSMLSKPQGGLMLKIEFIG